MQSHDQSNFNSINIDLRNKRIQNFTDLETPLSFPNRTVIYSDYPKIQPTNHLYTSHSTIKTHGSKSQTLSSAHLVNRRQKFDPQTPRRPTDWLWLSILCIILFFPSGLFAFAFARKAQIKFRDGFVADSHKFNKRALFLCVLSIVCGITLSIGLLFGFDAWPRTNG